MKFDCMFRWHGRPARVFDSIGKYHQGNTRAGRPCHAMRLIVPLLFLFFSHRVGAAPTTAHAATQAEESFFLDRTIHPALADHASLKIKLLPSYAEQIAGNAAPLYMVAADLPLRDGENPMDPKAEHELFSRYTDLLSVDADEKFPIAEAVSILQKYSEQLEQSDIAAHCDHADWANSMRDRGIHSMLPYMTRTRKLGLLLSFKAKVQCAQGDFKG